MVAKIQSRRVKVKAERVKVKEKEILTVDGQFNIKSKVYKFVFTPLLKISNPAN